ncbi:MAG: helix-turn-helix transcriptional regulator [Pseudomonadota bacterium]
MPPSKETLGQRIRRFRMAANLTQLELAIATHSAPNQVCNWEADRHIPTTQTLIPLARALEVTCHELIEGVEEPVRREKKQ